MITTADWLRYIESLGPTNDTQALRLRVESAGAEPAYAEWLLKLVRQRRIAKAASRAGMTMLTAGVAWSAYQWWLALSGSPNAPDGANVAFVAALVGVGAVVIVISSAFELSPPLDLSQHTIPAELGPPPRQVGVSVRSFAARRLALGVFCMMLTPLALSVGDTRDRVWLRDRGVETTGHVTSTFTKKGSKGHVSYFFGYAFDRGSGIQSVPRSRFEQMHEGDPVPVTYLPLRPEISRARTKAQLASWFSFEDPMLAAVLVYFIVVMPIVALLAGHVVSEQRALAERGVATVAEVTESRRQVIEYRFGERTGRFLLRKRRLRERPAPGQPLVVLYDPDKPKRNAPLGAMGDFEFR